MVYLRDIDPSAAISIISLSTPKSFEAQAAEAASTHNTQPYIFYPATLTLTSDLFGPKIVAALWHVEVINIPNSVSLGFQSFRSCNRKSHYSYKGGDLV